MEGGLVPKTKKPSWGGNEEVGLECDGQFAVDLPFVWLRPIQVGFAEPALGLPLFSYSWSLTLCQDRVTDQAESQEQGCLENPE